METMNIYAKEGNKVIFKFPNNGYDEDIENAKKYLTHGEKYTVEYTEVGGSITYVKLKEFTDTFNSVLFMDSE